MDDVPAVPGAREVMMSETASEPFFGKGVIARYSPASDASRPSMILQRLREETRSAHTAIERDLEMLRAHSCMDSYRLLVGRFFGFYEEWEPRVATMLADEAFFAPRRKTWLLEQDLTDLGYSAEMIAALPRCPALPSLTTPVEALGSIYVLEGATLGGQIISKRVEHSLGLSGDRGYAFFRSYGREARAMWRSFGERLLLLPADAGDVCVRSAQSTFARLHAWLCGGA